MIDVDRIVVPAAVTLGIGAGTILPVIRATARTGTTGLTFQQPRRDLKERVVGGLVGLLGAGHGLWGVLYAALGPAPLGVRVPPPWLFWAGAGLYLAGVAMVVAAQATMGRAWRIGIDSGKTELVTAGLYSVVRNPIYTGVIVCGFGMLAMTPSIVNVIGALGYLVLINVQARLEERHLYDQHGLAFRRFTEEVGRFVPHLFPRGLRPSERALLGKVAEALIPPGRTLPGAGDETVARIAASLDAAPRASTTVLRLTLLAIEWVCVFTDGRRFSELDRDAREALLARWLERAPGMTRHALRALVALVKSAHLELPATAEALGARSTPAPVAAETPRWLAQMSDGIEVKDDEEIEVDAVVVGTGAGGAPVAYELASRGHAVLLIEEGRYFGRHEFAGRPSQIARKMYRDGGMTFATGNTFTPIWAGMTVGGTTTVNSGTCYRTPERTLRAWREELGLEMFSSSSMDRHFARVERILGIAPSAESLLGGGGRRIRKGAELLKMHGAPIRRNAPDCDGQGRCCFGCPSDAKRSTNVSYIPMALERGAQLYARTRAEHVIVEKGRAAGVVARTAAGARLTVRAKVTILSCGTLMTPLMLLGDKIANSSGMVGQNLSIHPAAPVLALFDEPIEMERNIPQSFAIDHFADEGMMLEESGNPPEVVGVALPLIGRRFVEVIEQYPRMSAYGYMIKDTSRGRVTRGPQGRLSMTYSLNEDDTRRMQRCAEALVELYLASGARVVFPALRGVDEIRGERGLSRLRARRAEPGDFALSAVHPLGTARMGVDPKTSVVNPEHETHDVRDLFIVDGSAVPSSLGVNPQVTIMAMATRVAELIHARL